MSRVLFRMTVFAVAIGSVPATADDARAVIDKGIAAMGGEAKISKFNSMTWKSRGVFHTANGDTPYSAEYAVQMPDKFRFAMEGRFTLILNGDQGWIVAGGNSTEIPRDQFTEQKKTVYAGLVSRLLVLKDKEYTLATVGESKVNDRPAVGVRVSRKDQPTITLYFDKESHLLVKRERRIHAFDLGMEVTLEEFYLDYKDIDGFKFPSKAESKRDGKVLVEAEMFEPKAHEALDPKLFEKE